ncbi:hypothetical protein BvCmsSINP043_01058 [Escherichia coli]|nr:hypothetical protein BvCmsSINP043_01058 [Escherichia coli]
MERQVHNAKVHNVLNLLRMVNCCISQTVHFRLWQSAKWRGGKYGGVILTPLVAPGCQVDHTLK